MKYIIKSVNDYKENELYEFYKIIHKEKRKKIDKYKNIDDKKRSIIGEMILKELLSKEDVDYNETEFTYNEYGKPFMNNNIYFNISHSDQYIIVAISNKEIGIDIERIKKTQINVIDQFASDKEKEYILKSPNNIEERLFQIYTLKESYLKMKGTNLNDISNVEFIINNDNITCSDNNVNIGLIKDISDYIISYCEKR